MIYMYLYTYIYIFIYMIYRYRYIDMFFKVTWKHVVIDAYNPST